MCLDSTTNNTPTSDRDEQSALDSETKLDEDLQTRTSELIEQINGINLRILWDTTSDAENQIFSSYLSWFKTQMDLIEMGRSIQIQTLQGEPIKEKMTQDWYDTKLTGAIMKMQKLISHLSTVTNLPSTSDASPEVPSTEVIDLTAAPPSPSGRDPTEPVITLASKPTLLPTTNTNDANSQLQGSEARRAQRHQERVKKMVDEVIKNYSTMSADGVLHVKIPSANTKKRKRENQIAEPEESRPAKRKFTDRATTILVKWFEDNIQNTYADQATTKRLAEETGLEYGQIKKWLCNRRDRKLKKV